MRKRQAFVNPFEYVTSPHSEFSTFMVRSSLIIWQKTRRVNNVFGVVFIKKIEKGKNYDIVYGDIGFGRSDKTWKQFICQTQISRKQLYTLTVNQYALVYALSMKDNKVFYVKTWWASYVPKVHDREDIERNPEFEPFEKIDETKEISQDGLDLLDELERIKK